MDDLVELVNSPIAVPLGQELLTCLSAGTVDEWLPLLKAQPEGFPVADPRLAVLRPDPPERALPVLSCGWTPRRALSAKPGCRCLPWRPVRGRP